VIENTIERLRHIIAEDLDVNIKLDDIQPDAPLLEEGLKLDSLALVELITLTEEKFEIQFGEDDLNMESFASLRRLAAVIESHRISAMA